MHLIRVQPSPGADVGLNDIVNLCAQKRRGLMSANATNPQPGDVIFLNASDVKTLVNRIGQVLLDQDAAASPRTFGHVAIVVSDRLAIEAMPADPDDLTGQSPRLPHTAKIGPWTGAELRAGVRLIPIPDLIIPTIQQSAGLVVLRNPDIKDADLSQLSPFNDAVLRMLGSQYSIELLTKQAAAKLPEHLMGIIGPKLNWTSVPIDLASRLDSETRRTIEKNFTNLARPVARTYFCSQLVKNCLEVTSLIPGNVATEGTTPSGLYRKLNDRKWRNVTDEYFCEPEAETYRGRTRLSYTTDYTETLGHITLRVRLEEDKVLVDTLSAAFEEANKTLEGHLDALLAMRDNSP